MHEFIREIALIATGGASGALARYWSVAFAHDNFRQKFALGKLSVNVLGSLLIGIRYVLISKRLVLHPDWRHL